MAKEIKYGVEARKALEAGVDQVADTKGILLITDRVLALFPDGNYSFIATQQNSENTGSMMDETIGISPEMQQKLDEQNMINEAEKESEALA